MSKACLPFMCVEKKVWKACVLRESTVTVEVEVLRILLVCERVVAMLCKEATSKGKERRERQRLVAVGGELVDGDAPILELLSEWCRCRAKLSLQGVHAALRWIAVVRRRLQVRAAAVVGVCLSVQRLHQGLKRAVDHRHIDGESADAVLIAKALCELTHAHHIIANIGRGHTGELTQDSLRIVH